jgi:hypothetical protein
MLKTSLQISEPYCLFSSCEKCCNLAVAGKNTTKGQLPTTQCVTVWLFILQITHRSTDQENISSITTKIFYEEAIA